MSLFRMDQNLSVLIGNIQLSLKVILFFTLSICHDLKAEGERSPMGMCARILKIHLVKQTRDKEMETKFAAKIESFREITNNNPTWDARTRRYVMLFNALLFTSNSSESLTFRELRYLIEQWPSVLAPLTLPVGRSRYSLIPTQTYIHSSQLHGRFAIMYFNKNERTLAWEELNEILYWIPEQGEKVKLIDAAMTSDKSRKRPLVTDRSLNRLLENHVEVGLRTQLLFRFNLSKPFELDDAIPYLRKVLSYATTKLERSQALDKWLSDENIKKLKAVDIITTLQMVDPSLDTSSYKLERIILLKREELTFNQFKTLLGRIKDENYRIDASQYFAQRQTPLFIAPKDFDKLNKKTEFRGAIERINPLYIRNRVSETLDLAGRSDRHAKKAQEAILNELMEIAPKVPNRSLPVGDRYPYQYLGHSDGAEKITLALGGFAKVKSFEESLKIRPLTRGEHLYFGLRDTGIFRFVVVRVEDRSVLLLNLTDLSMNRMSISDLTEEYGHLIHRGSSPPEYLGPDLLALAGYERVKSTDRDSDFHQFYNSLRYGDEIVFAGKDTHKWTFLTYTKQIASVRNFQDFNSVDWSGHTRSFNQYAYSPNALLSRIENGTLRVRKSQRQWVEETVDPEIYPNLSVAIQENLELQSKIINDYVSRETDQGRIILSEKKVAQFNNTMMHFATEQLIGLNDRRQRELRSIRVARGMNETSPFNPNQISYSYGMNSVNSLGPQALSTPLQMDFFMGINQKRQIPFSISVEETTSPVAYQFDVHSISEAQGLFIQVLESMYAAELESHLYWRSNNIPDFRVLHIFMSNQTHLESKNEQYIGIITPNNPRGGGPSPYTLTITSKDETANSRDLPLLDGLVWGHRPSFIRN